MYGDKKYQDEVLTNLYHAVWEAQNALGERNAAEAIIHAFGNPEELAEEIKRVRKDIDFEIPIPGFEETNELLDKLTIRKTPTSIKDLNLKSPLSI